MFSYDNIFLDSVDSTQTYCKKHFRSFSKDLITCVIAQQQTQGKGTKGRSWVSPKGGNVYVTFTFFLNEKINTLRSLAQLIAISTATVLTKETVPISLKWPNDIQIHGKKVGGAMCEIETLEKGTEVFLGLGLNLHTDKAILETIDQPATSLELETNKQWDSKALIKKIQLQFAKDLDRFLSKGFSIFSKQYWQLLAYKKQRITIDDGVKTFEGKLENITPEGELIVQLTSGKNATITSATIRPKK